MYSSSKFIIEENIQNPLFSQLNNINISLINDNNSLKENNIKYEIGLIRRFEFISLQRMSVLVKNLNEEYLKYIVKVLQKK